MPTVTGDVQLTILDGGGSTVSVASQRVQVVIGCSSIGTVGRVFATRSINALIAEVGYGPGPEAAALTINKGGTVIFVKAETIDDGFVRGSDSAAKSITGVTNASPAVITATAHGFPDGAIVTIAGVGGSTGVNGTFRISVLSANTFSVPVAAGGVYTSGGTAQWTGTVMSNPGTSTDAPVISGDALDDLYVQLTVVKAGTVGTAGIQFTVSLDAGRTAGAPIVLGTALTYDIPNTGLTATFHTTKTLAKGAVIQASTVAPAPTTAAVQTCVDALRNSEYGIQGWGAGTHIVGVWDGTDASDFQDSLEELATDAHIYTRAKIASRDASPPAVWGGTGETEVTWMGDVIEDFSVDDAKRVQVGAGYYNVTSGIQNPAAGTPRYRRSLIWVEAAKQVTIQPNRHSGRVRDGALSIKVDPTNDSKDGFIYHDESVNVGFDSFLPGGAGRFTSARRRVGKTGWFVSNPLTLAEVNSNYQLYPRGAVADIASQILVQIGQDEIGDDLRTNDNGTIFETDARRMESSLDQALQDNMVKMTMITDESVSVDRTNDIDETSQVNIAAQIHGRAFVLQLNITLGYQSAS